ncbi:MAG: radical SAM protein [Myxococcota bacterium]|nr:radical SAM protein [Myxococcota bacterium]
MLQVEPTDHCNLSCAMCIPHHDGWDQIHGVDKGTLDSALLERIVDGLVADGVSFDHVIFQWLGDPSLHPDLEGLVEYTGRRMAGCVNYLRIDTNAILLGPERMARLVTQQRSRAENGKERPPLLVVFTLDAQSPAIYERVKGRDHLDRVRRNIRALLRLRRQEASPCPINVQVQFVVQEENAHEARAFHDYWLDLLSCQGGPGWHDEILFKRLSVGGGTKGQSDADDLYVRALDSAGIQPTGAGNVQVRTWTERPWQHDDLHRGSRNACPGLWATPVIRHDGHLMMCCADLGGELDLGSLDEQGFLDLWEGPDATLKRLEHLSGRFEGVCAGCGGINWYALTPQMEQSALERGSELGLRAPATAGEGTETETVSRASRSQAEQGPR